MDVTLRDDEVDLLRIIVRDYMDRCDDEAAKLRPAAFRDTPRGRIIAESYAAWIRRRDLAQRIALKID